MNGFRAKERIIFAPIPEDSCGPLMADRMSNEQYLRRLGDVGGIKRREAIPKSM